MDKVRPAVNQVRVSQGQLSKPSAESHEMRVDVFETGRFVVVHVALAGCEIDNIQVGVKGNRLLISAERGPGEPYTDTVRKYLKREIPENNLWREVKLPIEVDPDKVEAHYANGMLVVSVARDQFQHGSPNPDGKQ